MSNLEDKLIERAKHIQELYNTEGGQIGAPPEPVKRESPVPLHLKCLDEIKKIEQDFAAGVSIRRVQTNLHDRFKEYDDPCWDCAWDYLTLKLHINETLPALESIQNSNPESLSNPDVMASVREANGHSITATRSRAEALTKSCGIDTTHLRDLLTEELIANNVSDFDKAKAIRLKIESEFPTVIHHLLPKLSIVKHPAHVTPEEERAELTQEEVNKESARLAELEAQGGLDVKPLIKCPTCEKRIPFKGYAEHVMTEHECPVCKAKFLTRKKIGEHIRLVHATYKSLAKDYPKENK